MDLQGDEELEALRLAALATLKSSSKKKNPDSFAPDNISKVSTLVTSKPSDQPSYSIKDASDRSQGSVYSNQHSWRNSQASRRGRGRQGFQFPKGNQRSNLIVITPVNLCKKTDEKETPPQLVLPQHKWCQSVNEDSSSPKSYRRIGPTRFNRHGSDSESSDESDHDNSENDSYSNDTVLQDERSESFATFTTEENTEDERLVQKQQKPLDRRLSFHNIESQEKETEGPRNCRTDSFSNCSKEETKVYKAATKDESKHEKELPGNHRSVNSIGEEQVPKTRSHSPVQFKKSQSSSLSVNGNSHSKRDNTSRNHVSSKKETDKYSQKYSDKPVEADSHRDCAANDSKNNSKNLSDGDLRYELKKRMQEKPFKTVTSRSQNDSYNHRPTEQNRNHVRLRRSNSSEDSNHAYRHKSRENRFHERKSEAQSRSSSENDRSASPDRSRITHSRLQTDSRMNHNHKRAHSNSSDRSYKRSRSQSPEQRAVNRNRGPRWHSGSSSSSTSSSSNSSKSSSRSSRIRLVSSVVKPVVFTNDSKSRSNDVSEKHSLLSTEPISTTAFKRRRNDDEKPKILSSVKSSVCGNEKHVNNSDIVKRVPVHMRLGTLPHKRVIRMTKDVEAAFVCTSSDEDTDAMSTKYKKQNFRVVTELSGNKLDDGPKRHVEKGTCRSVDVFKGRRMKIER